jgi:hypothetical protein
VFGCAVNRASTGRQKLDDMWRGGVTIRAARTEENHLLNPIAHYVTLSNRGGGPRRRPITFLR